MKLFKLFFVLLTALTVAACGSGSGTTISQLPYTKATLSFSASAIGGTPAAPLQIIQMTVKLPQGASIALADVSTAVVGKNGHVPQFISYSTTDNTVSFLLSDPDIKLGDTFVDVTCDTDKSVTDASFTAANTPSYPLLEMSGVNSTTGDSVDLVPQIKIAMAVTRR